jgi:ribosomal protein S21
MEVIIAGNDIEGGLRRFKKLVSISGVLTSIKFRELFPNLTDRKREKAKRAVRRNKKRDARREHGY